MNVETIRLKNIGNDIFVEIEKDGDWLTVIKEYADIRESTFDHMVNLDRLQEDEVDWVRTEEHLKVCEAAYAEAGSAGRFVVTMYITPARDRFNKGERTQDLHNEIMAISL